MLQRLPQPLVDLLKDQTLTEMYLREEEDISLWDVGVVLEKCGRMYLKRGWQSFARRFSFNQGDFVHFCFDGFDVLTVKVFDPTMCRKRYQHRDDSSSDSDDDEIIERGTKILYSLFISVM